VVHFLHTMQSVCLPTFPFLQTTSLSSLLCDWENLARIADILDIAKIRSSVILSAQSSHKHRQVICSRSVCTLANTIHISLALAVMVCARISDIYNTAIVWSVFVSALCFACIKVFETYVPSGHLALQNGFLQRARSSSEPSI
jgi:hypothetical protein